MNAQKTNWVSHAIFYSIILMMASLFISRAVLSISFGLFFLLCFFHDEPKKHLENFLKAPLLWGMSLLLLIPLISFFWSEDVDTWSNVVRVKLPLLLFPLAIAGPWQLSRDQWKRIAVLFLVFVLAGTAWSIVQYLPDSAAIHELYFKAKTIPVPLEGDHIRFSWMVCIAFIIGTMLLIESARNVYRILLAMLCLWFLVYLHILAARTGLFASYIFLFAFVIHHLFKWKSKIGLAVLGMALLLPVIAWFCFPTFQNRFKYLRYDFDFVKNSSYLQGATDGNRIFSMKAGWNIVWENPLGVGAGDLRQQTMKWYDANVPGMVEMDKIYPSNEWLIYGGFAGWPGILLFTIAVLAPFFPGGIHKRFYWHCFHATALFSFLVDTGLEVQYGVFLYGFITCCWWKAMRKTEVQFL